MPDVVSEENPVSIKIDIESISVDVSLDYIENVGIREASFVLHEHAVHEFYYIESGSMKIECCGAEYHLTQGDFFIIKAGASHRIISVYDGLKRFHMRFRFYDESYNDKLVSTMFLHKYNEAEFIKRIAEIRAFALNESSKFSFYRFKANIGIILCEIFEKNCICYESHRYELKKGNRLQIFSIIDSFLGANCCRHITVDDLAKHLNYSKMQTHRIVTECCGMSFSQKLREVRMRIAKQLLVSSSLSIYEIAVRCGYETRHGFENAFHKYTELYPAAYREKMINRQ